LTHRIDGGGFTVYHVTERQTLAMWAKAAQR
jgi:hypothetical protein